MRWVFGLTLQQPDSLTCVNMLITAAMPTCPVPTTVTLWCARTLSLATLQNSFSQRSDIFLVRRNWSDQQVLSHFLEAIESASVRNRVRNATPMRSFALDKGLYVRMFRLTYIHTEYSLNQFISLTADPLASVRTRGTSSVWENYTSTFPAGPEHKSTHTDRPSFFKSKKRKSISISRLSITLISSSQSHWQNIDIFSELAKSI